MKLLSALLLLLVPLLASSQRDCSSIFRRYPNSPSGVYTIYPTDSTPGIQVYCDMDSHGGRWTVFQRRMDGTVNFYRNWNDYKLGFGNADGEYWLGLENVYVLTQHQQYELIVDMEDFEGNKVYARYTSFSVGSESDGYSLHVGDYIDGGAGNTLKRHNGQGWQTFDRYLHTGLFNCAQSFLGAFWYWRCYYGNPNGVYIWGANGSEYVGVGVIWNDWKVQYNQPDYSLKAISMKIRPV
ncbi:microfibril-associated glycoprotein 4-like [Xiphophorus couchianus]|uniref:microfibril-associated glycoprotein 4-like n=1 Tax=Xiphophorus couchianus TaxID=32473 RepID=UPI0010167C90|nr:microfibril-associated glycoprotein 4-like [Xiphophorus couchianus]